MPWSTRLLTPAAAAGPERLHPLRVLVCADCRLVQLAAAQAPPLTTFAGPAAAARGQGWAGRMIRKLGLGRATPVLEIGAQDDALAAAMRRAGIPATTLDPAMSAAFGAPMARRLRALGPPPSLLVVNDLLARTSDLNGLVEGVRLLLAPGGVVAFELGHLLRQMQAGAIGAFGHDRAIYPSLLVAELILGQHGLVVFEAEESEEDRGALRLLARHVEDRTKPVGAAVCQLRAAERRAGLEAPGAYARFASQVVETKCALLDFLLGMRRGGRRVAAFGATAEGVMLLNHVGAGPDLLSAVVDPDPARQGLLVPGVRLPVWAPQALLRHRPDFLLILPPWRAETVMEEMAVLREWGGRFVLATPLQIVG